MWAKRKSFGNGATEHAVLERLAAQLDKEGALAVLRHGFKDGNATFQMCQFQPSHDFNPDLRAMYKQVRCPRRAPAALQPLPSPTASQLRRASTWCSSSTASPWPQ